MSALLGRSPGRHRSPRAPLGRASALTNLGAQAGALACLTLASLAVARRGGPSVLGEYTLLRVLPWLAGVLLSAGLPVASTYFLSGGRGTDPRMRPTLTVIVLAGCGLGATAWWLLVPLLGRYLFPGVPIRLLLLASACVVTQLLTVWTKACCQGAADMTGSNLVIVAEELWFLPAYAVASLTGLTGLTAVLAGLVAGGTLSTLTGLGRLRHQGFFRGWGRPSPALAREVATFGARGQLGNLLWLMNLRLDFIVLGVLSGPAVLGVYAVASKFAELMRLPATAVNYVLYPRFARMDADSATAELDRLLPRALLLTVCGTPLLAGLVVVVLPRLYGVAFQAAVAPACVLLVGLSVEGAAAVASAYLMGTGRPGLNTWGMGVGVLVTIGLDLALIPRHGALGAAVASSIAYLATTGLLTALARWSSVRPARTPARQEAFT